MRSLCFLRAILFVLLAVGAAAKPNERSLGKSAAREPIPKALRTKVHKTSVKQMRRYEKSLAMYVKLKKRDENGMMPRPLSACS